MENLHLTISENTKFDVLVKSQKNDLFTYELADLETEHVRILALVMNQILNLMDAKGVDNAFLELHQSPKPEQNKPDHRESQIGK